MFNLLVLLFHAASAQSVNASTCCRNAQDATVFSLIYGSPLIAFFNETRGSLGFTGTNVLLPVTELATPNSTAVKTPNPSTLFTAAWLDLSRHDLVITVPAFNDTRFWSLPFYDPYGDNFATISSIAHSEPGDYLLRFAPDEEPGLSFNSSSSSEYKGVVSFATNYATLAARIFVLNNTGDLPVARRYQAGIKLREAPQNSRTSTAPALTLQLIDVGNITSPALQALTLLSRIGYYNQPANATERERVAQIFAQAGVFNGNYTQPAGVDLRTAEQSALTKSKLAVSKGAQTLANEWSIQNPAYQGNFGRHYGVRSFIGSQGYLENTPDITLYPNWEPAVSGLNTTLGPDEAYLLTFHGRPPIVPESGGWWACTVYDADFFFVQNPLNRYALGIVSNLTYPDGRPVYPVALNNGTAVGTMASGKVDSEQAFKLLLQPGNITPPANWTSNWLPTPTGSQPFSFNLRLYAPQEHSKIVAYDFPLVQRIKAITA